MQLSASPTVPVLRPIRLSLRLRHALCSSLAALLLMLSTGANASTEVDETQQLERYIGVFERQSALEMRQVIKALPGSGISDPRLFDLIEARLIEAWQKVYDRQTADAAAWLAKGLAYSGDERYRKTLQQVCDSRESRRGALKRHCENALEELGRYKAMNAVIADRSGWVEGHSDAVNRYASMLRSDNFDAQRMAAQRIHHQHLYDEWLLDQLEQAVKRRIGGSYDDDEEDAVGWLIRALAGPAIPRYRPTLEDAAIADDGDIRGYARRFIKKYYG